MDPSGAEGDWPEDWSGPKVPTADPADWRAVEADIRDVLQRTLRTLLQDSVPSEAMVVEMDALCSQRSEAELSQYHQAWDRTRGRAAPKSRSIPAPVTSTSGSHFGQYFLWNLDMYDWHQNVQGNHPERA
jgi:hypothetical protein